MPHEIRLLCSNLGGAWQQRPTIQIVRLSRDNLKAMWKLSYFSFIKSSSNFINIFAARIIAWQIRLLSSLSIVKPPCRSQETSLPLPFSSLYTDRESLL